MMDKFLRGGLIFLCLFVLLLVGWSFEAFLGWSDGSMWLWPIVPVAAWFFSKKLRRIWIHYTAHRLLVKQEAVQTTPVAVDKDWAAILEDFRHISGITEQKPWAEEKIHFMVGLKGSGKTALLRNSGDAIKPLETRSAENESCRLAFMPGAVCIEINGRYFDPVGEGADQDLAWENLLAGINDATLPDQCGAIVVCLSIRQMLDDYSNTIRGMKAIRRRISDLMLYARRCLPAYVVLTDSDFMPSLRDLIPRLPDDLRIAPSGVLVSKGSGGDAKSSYHHALLDIINYLPWLGLRSAGTGRAMNGLGVRAAFELESLREQLEGVLKAFFDATNYNQPPIFRGLFLTSAFDADASALMRSDSTLPAPAAFGSGFFSRVLAYDSVSEPLMAYETREARRQRIRRSAVHLGFAAAFVWMLWGYVDKRASIHHAASFKPISFVMPDTFYGGVRELINARPNVSYLEEEFAWRWSDLLPFRAQSRPLDHAIKDNFLMAMTNIRNFAIDSVRVKLEDLEPEERAMVIEYLCRRYNILKSAGEHRSLSYMKELPQPSPELLPWIESRVSYEDSLLFNHYFLLSVLWDEHEGIISRSHYYSSVIQQIANSLTGLDWLLVWADHQPGVREINLTDFWSPDAGPSVTKIRGAYTREGRAAIQGLLNELNGIPSVHTALNTIEENFLDAYRAERTNEWVQFIRSFHEGRDLLKTEQEWISVLTTFNGRASPYRSLEHRILEDFSAKEDKQNTLNWPSTLATFADIRKAAPGGIVNAVTGKFSILKSAGKTLLRSGSEQGGGHMVNNANSLMDAGSTYQVYSDALAKAIATAVTAPGKAAALASDFSGFGRDAKISDSPLMNAMHSEQRLEGLLDYEHRSENEMAWIVMRGEVETTLDYVYRQAACKIQDEWNGSVVWADSTSISQTDAWNKVFAEQGVLWKFLDDPAGPFLIRKSDTFVASNLSGWQLAWDDHFFPFVNQAVREMVDRKKKAEREDAAEKFAAAHEDDRLKQVLARLAEINKDLDKFYQTNFQIKISAKPVRANFGSAKQPHGIGLKVACGEKSQTLRHLNFSTQETLVWNAKSCEDAELSILIGDAEMILRWRGWLGFPDMLHEFASGEKVFVNEDFEEFAVMLEELGVKKISVSFDIRGGREMTDAVQRALDELRERDALEAEKLALERAKALREQKRLDARLDQLAPAMVKMPQVPKVAAQCLIKRSSP